jgi:hypothetical protein
MERSQALMLQPIFHALAIFVSREASKRFGLSSTRCNQVNAVLFSSFRASSIDAAAKGSLRLCSLQQQVFYVRLPEFLSRVNGGLQGNLICISHDLRGRGS